jgi:hypothetical protein
VQDRGRDVGPPEGSSESLPDPPGCSGQRLQRTKAMRTSKPGAQARLHLLDANRDAIAVMLARAATGGVAPEGAVVVVLDQRDAVGRELASAAAEKAGLLADDEAEQIQSRGQIPTAIIVVPLAGARVLFSESHPEVERGLARSPRPQQVRVVVIADGAAMLVHAEVSSHVGQLTAVNCRSS